MQKIKIGLLGSGKTGGEVLKILNTRTDLSVTVFNSKNNLTEQALKNCQLIIAFVSGEVLSGYLPILKRSGICVISGCTGMKYPENHLDECLKQNQLWIQGNNFSLAMVAIKAALKNLAKLQTLSSEYHFALKEIHHTKKLDKPSGTALNWKNWLNISGLEIESVRQGDEIGTHTVTINSPNETITLEHVAHSRKLFATGAVWAMDQALTGKIPAKFYFFEELVENFLK